MRIIMTITPTTPSDPTKIFMPVPEGGRMSPGYIRNPYGLSPEIHSVFSQNIPHGPSPEMPSVPSERIPTPSSNTPAIPANSSFNDKIVTCIDTSTESTRRKSVDTITTSILVENPQRIILHIMQTTIRTNRITKQKTIEMKRTIFTETRDGVHYVVYVREPRAYP